MADINNPKIDEQLAELDGIIQDIDEDIVDIKTAFIEAGLVEE